MAKRRSRQGPVFRAGTLVKAAMLCLLIGGAGIGYVWQKEQVLELGERIKQRENRLSELRYENQKRKTRLDALLTTEALEKRANELGLGLREPTPAQRLRLAIREPAREAEPEGRQFADYSVSMRISE